MGPPGRVRRVLDNDRLRALKSYPMRPLGKLTAEADRLRGRIEAIERLAAESRMAAEAQREDEQRVEEELALFYAMAEAMDSLPEKTPLLSTFFGELPRALQAERMVVLHYHR